MMPGKRREPPHAAAPAVPKEQLFLRVGGVVAVISGAEEGQRRESVLTSSARCAINWHTLTPCIHLHMFK